MFSLRATKAKTPRLEAFNCAPTARNLASITWHLFTGVFKKVNL